MGMQEHTGLVVSVRDTKNRSNFAAAAAAAVVVGTIPRMIEGRRLRFLEGLELSGSVAV